MSGYVGSMFELGAAPAIERTMVFAERRHRLILSNIANSDTPGYRRLDLDKGRFQRDLGEAIRMRDERHPGLFVMKTDSHTPVSRGHALSSRRISTGDEGPLRHDANNVSMEREMAQLAQNAGRYTTFAELLRKAFDQIRSAISERPSQG